MTDSHQRLAELIIAGDGAAAKALTESMLADGHAADILDQGLMRGMDEVGTRMKAGTCFIPEVLLSARCMQGCLDVLRPHLDAGKAGAGTVVIGTVEGDVHDIGKNLVAMMLESGGFTVVNVGTGVAAAAFVAAAQEHDADIVAMSALLTTTIPRMRETIEALRDAGLRDTVRVLIGGAPVTQQYADEIGADAYGANAAAAVDSAKRLVGAGAV